MPTIILLLVPTLLSAAIFHPLPSTDDSCQLHFAVTERTQSGVAPMAAPHTGITQGALRRFGAWNSIDSAEHQQEKQWPEAAQKWWDKDGKKKFPYFCESHPEQADVIFLWESGWTTGRILESVWKKETRSIPQQRCEPPDHYGNTYCTTYEVEQEYDILVFEDRGDRQIERMSVIITRYQEDDSIVLKTIVKTGNSLWGRPPAPSAFESAMKFLRKQRKAQSLRNASQTR